MWAPLESVHAMAVDCRGDLPLANSQTLPPDQALQALTSSVSLPIQKVKNRLHFWKNFGLKYFFPQPRYCIPTFILNDCILRLTLDELICGDLFLQRSQTLARFDLTAIWQGLDREEKYSWWCGSREAGKIFSHGNKSLFTVYHYSSENYKPKSFFRLGSTLSIRYSIINK